MKYTMKEITEYIVLNRGFTKMLEQLHLGVKLTELQIKEVERGLDRLGNDKQMVVDDLRYHYIQNFEFGDCNSEEDVVLLINGLINQKEKQ